MKVSFLKIIIIAIVLVIITLLICFPILFFKLRSYDNDTDTEDPLTRDVSHTDETLNREDMELTYQGHDVPLLSLCTQRTEECPPAAGSHSCCVDHLVTMLEELVKKLGSKIFILFGTLLSWKRYNG